MCLKKVLSLIATVFVFSGCATKSEFSQRENEIKKHIWTYGWSDEVIYDLTKTEEKEALEAFNTIIPESETEAHIYCIARKLDGKSEVSFILEFDKINNIDLFYESNAGRVHDNGLYGKSDNELLGYNEDDYYVSYSKTFHVYQDEEPWDAQYKVINDLFSVLKEARNGNED